MRKQIFKNRPQLSTVTKHAFYFDVAAKANNSNVFENYTLTGFYQILKDEEGGFVFTLSYTGMFKFDAEIPYNEKSILNDKNNVFSAAYTGNELQFIVRQKTVFI